MSVHDREYILHSRDDVIYLSYKMVLAHKLEKSIPLLKQILFMLDADIEQEIHHILSQNVDTHFTNRCIMTVDCTCSVMLNL